MPHDEHERRRWHREPVRIAPSEDPAEAVERLVSRRQLIVEDGDILLVRETAGLSSFMTTSTFQYRLSVRGDPGDRPRVFVAYERAAADGEALAARRRVRLFYVEEGALTLIKDYRTASVSKRRD